MSRRYLSCSSCEGQGSFPCTDCRCSNCNGRGTIICDKCARGYNPCYDCNTTGEIYKWIIFTSVCPECQGAGKLKCTTCSGQASIKCQRCLGSGYLEKCPECEDTRKIKCEECNGRGKIDSVWYKSLQDMSVERLRFEYEKIQNEIRNLQSEMSRLHLEENEFMREYNRSRDEEYKDNARYLEGKRDLLEIEVWKLQRDELKAVEYVLNNKL